MKNTFWDKRMPTLLSIGIIGIGLIITSFVLKTPTSIISRADITQMPQNVKVTNILDKSLTISYITEASNIGSINFGIDDSLGQIALDERDQETGFIRPRRTHSFTLKNLKPLTQYFFTIVSGNNTFLNNDVPYKVSTAPTFKPSQNQQFLVQGKVILSNGATPEEGLAYIDTERSQQLSTLVKSNGKYSLTLGSLLTKDLLSSLSLDENDVVEITITDGKLKSNILLLAKQISNIPVVTLSNDYDFTLATATTAVDQSAKVSFSSIETAIAPTQTPTPMPTIVPTSVVTPTLSPTPSLIAETYAPSPTSLQEAPLGNQSALAVGIAGVAVSLLGAFLFIITRGGISRQ